MPKSVHNDVLDAAFDVIKNNCTKMQLCEGAPASFSEANQTKGTGDGKGLADVAMTDTDFTIADGDTSGRKVTVAAKAGVPVDATGTADHVALIDVANSRLLLVTTATSQAVTSGNNVDFPAWDDEIADPS